MFPPAPTARQPWTTGDRLALALVLGIAAVVSAAWIGGERDQTNEAAYLDAHPVAARANAHFSACAVARDEMSRKDDPVMAGIGDFGWRLERCYRNNFDDPRYWDATWPWNSSLPRPW